MSVKQPVWTPDQTACIEALAVFRRGHHHLPRVHEFGTGVAINVYGDLCSHDGGDLTRLILVAHKYGIRVGIQQSGRGMVKITAFKRIHGDKKTLEFWKYHPDLKDLAAAAAKWEDVK